MGRARHHPREPGDAHYLFVDPCDTERLLLSDTSQLYASLDGGGSFHLVHTTDWPGGLLVGGVHWDGDDIYAGTSDGLLVSRDGGATFALDTSISGIPEGEKIVSFAAAGSGRRARLFAVTFLAADSDGNPLVTADTTGGELDAYAGLYRMKPGQRRWVSASNGLGPDDELAFVAASADDPDVAYVAGGDRETFAPIVLKTVDGGARWRHVFLTDHNANIDTGWSGFGGDMTWDFGEYALGLSVSPADPRRVAITDLGFVHVSDDGGKTFQQAYVKPADENPRGEDTPKSRFYRTSGVEQTSGWWLTFPEKHTIFASLTDIRSAYSEDGGKSWARDGANGLTLNTTYHVVEHPITGALYAATSSVHDLYQSAWLRDARIDGTPARPSRGGVMISEDEGATWSLVADLGRPVIWLALDPNDPDQLYASTVNSVTGGIVHLDLSAPGAAPEPLGGPLRARDALLDEGHRHRSERSHREHVVRDGVQPRRAPLRRAVPHPGSRPDLAAHQRHGPRRVVRDRPARPGPHVRDDRAGRALDHREPQRRRADVLPRRGVPVPAAGAGVLEPVRSRRGVDRQLRRGHARQARALIAPTLVPLPRPWYRSPRGARS